MIQLKTVLNCIDNTVHIIIIHLTAKGAALVECIHILNGAKKAYIGDRIVCVVQRVRQQTGQQEARKQVTMLLPKVNQGDIRRAIVVRTKQQYQRKDGSIVRFDDNACVLIDEKGEPIGNRIMGSLSPNYL